MLKPDPDERQLAEALAALVQQIDLADYRDAVGHPLSANLAYIHAQSIVDGYGVSHADICRALDRWSDDLGSAARSLRNLGRVRGEDGQRPSSGQAQPFA